MKGHLRCQKFADDDEVMEAVQSWLKATPKSFFSRGHPPACGQVDQVCCEAGGLCRIIRAPNNASKWQMGFNTYSANVENMVNSY